MTVNPPGAARGIFDLRIRICYENIGFLISSAVRCQIKKTPGISGRA